MGVFGAIKGAVKAPVKAVSNTPGMMALKKSLPPGMNAGMGGGNKMGLGPSNPPQMNPMIQSGAQLGQPPQIPPPQSVNPPMSLPPDIGQGTQMSAQQTNPMVQSQGQRQAPPGTNDPMFGGGIGPSNRIDMPIDPRHRFINRMPPNQM